MRFAWTDSAEVRSKDPSATQIPLDSAEEAALFS